MSDAALEGFARRLMDKSAVKRITLAAPPMVWCTKCEEWRLRDGTLEMPPLCPFCWG